MLVAEFLGAGFLTLVVMSVQTTLGSHYFVGVTAALAVVVLMLVFNAVSGAVLNPALAIALWTARRLKTVTAAAYVVVELLGAWVAYYLYVYFTQRGSLPVNTTNFDVRVAVAEAVGTLLLAMAWAAATYGRWTPSAKAVAVGLGYAVGMMVAGVAALGLINPDFAMADRAWYIWGANGGWGNYVLGPVVGAVVGVNVWAYLFAGQKLSTARVTSRTATTSKAKTTTTRRKTTSRRRK